MYQKVDPSGTAPESFEFPHGGKLASDNRWVMMAQLIPWSEFEAEYAQNFAASMGPPAKSFRMALGALIIKEKLGTSDRARGRTNQGEPIPAILYRFLIIQQ